jgi:BASS family bile acid:Na+ symporter
MAAQASLIPLAFSTSIFLLVLGIGLKATSRYATHLLRHPGQLVASLAAMYLVMPLFAVAVVLAFDLHPAAEIALVAIAVSPVPPFVPLKATKAGGARDYTLGLLVAASALAIVLVPLAVELVGAVFAKPFAMSPTTTARLVTSSVLAPLAIGMALRQFAPSTAEQMARPVSIASVALLVLALVPVLLDAWRPIVSLVGSGTVLSFAAFVAVGTVTGHLLGGPQADERGVLALACGSRHPGIALAIAHANFPDDKNVLPAVLLYLVIAALVAAPYLQGIRRRKGQEWR